MGMFSIKSSVLKKKYSVFNYMQRCGVLVKARQGLAGLGCFGTKAGMMTYYSDSGEALPSSVIVFDETNVVSQLKTKEKNGYDAVQIGYKACKEKNIKKPEMGHSRKIGAQPLSQLAEFRTEIDHGRLPGEKLLPKDLFTEGDLIDVRGLSIGKGFQGGIKRWNMHRGYMTHGSKSHRAPGSIGMRYSGGGGRVLPGLKMPGHLGNKRLTIRKLQVVDVDQKHNAITVKGATPGKPGGILRLVQTTKKL